ncbi:ExbD/TolR family protein [Caenispirillum salinarum]|uniref:ExbD/TolR family protein n=1 Tax=Caenispirillum salinarum TaxID=859058 RepID=UPI003850B5CD
MRFRQRHRPAPDGENVLPLINVVFLLLVFFMVAGALERADLFEVTPPEAAVEAEPEDRQGLLLMAADGRLALGGAVVAEGDLAAAVQAWREANPDVTLKVKADAAAEALAVVGLLEDLRAAGVEQVVLLTTEAG